MSSSVPHIIKLTSNQQYGLKNYGTRHHPFGAQREFADKRLVWSMFAKTINLKKLASGEVQAFRDLIEAYHNAITNQKRAATTRRSLRRKLAVIDTFIGLSAVDRLGSIVK